MLFSFNGTYRPYTYNCPQSFKFRAVDKIYPPRDEEPELPDEGNARQMGIIRHKELGDYMLGITTGEIEANAEPPFDISENDFINEVVADIAKAELVSIESEFFTDTDYHKIASKRAKPDVIYARPDMFMTKGGKLWLIDWKFGNHEFGASVYYKETEWFIAVLAACLPDIDEFESMIHFPNAKYTLPRRVYSRSDAAGLQMFFKTFINEVQTTRVFFSRPGRARCRLCDYRSEDTGGMGYCEDAAL